jgi:hypothetical protein
MHIPTSVWSRVNTLDRVIFLLALLLVTAAPIFGQSAGFGSISGVVQDPTGAVIPGAKIIVENPSKGIRREMDSTSAGTFTAQALVPASGYQVSIAKDGFGKFEIKGITVLVGENVSLAPVLRVTGSASEVIVTGEAPIIDSTKTGGAAVVTSQQILDLPQNGRRVDVFVLTNPGVVADGTFGLLAFRGNPGGNAFLTDGNDTTNQYYNENAGRTRTYNISQDAVQEFQVVTSNFSAEYGKASGGVVNTVTRSGSNGIHGSAYEFFRNRTLNAVDGTTRTAANGLFPNGINPPEWRHQAGLSIGGPIVKNKLFYFFNGELMRRNAPVVSSNIGAGAGNNLFDGSANLLQGTTVVNGVTNYKPYTWCVNHIAQAMCDAAGAYLKERVRPQLIDRKMDNNLLFGKIDFRPNEKDSFSFSANYLDFRSPNGIQTQLSLTNGNAIGNNADTNVFDRTARASWTRVVTPHLLNELRFGLFKDRQYDPASPSLVPEIDGNPFLSGLTVSGVSNVGYATDYPRLNPSELRLSIADSVSWSVGKHTLKFGADVGYIRDYVDILRSKFGSFTYSANAVTGDPSGLGTAFTNFALDFTNGTKNYQSFNQARGTSIVNLVTKEYAFYATDEYRLTPKLTIRPGLRVEFTKLPQPSLCSNIAVLSATCHIPGGDFNWAPRFGVAYALTPKTTVRAGYGLFYNRYTTATIQNLFISNGVYQQSVQYNTTTNPGPNFGSFFPNTTNLTPQLNATVITADKGFRNPYSQQAELAIEREILKNTSLSVSYVWSRGLHLLQTRNDNILAPTTTRKVQLYSDANATVPVGSAFDIPVYTAKNVAKYPGYDGPVYQLQSAGNSYYNGLLVQVTRRYSSWFSGSASYTYSHSIDYNQAGAPTFGSAFSTSVVNGDYKGERGSSSLDLRHRLGVNVVFSPKFMTSDSALAKYVVNGWQLGVLNVNESSRPIVPTINVGSTAPGLVNPTSTRTLNGLSGSSRVPWESISALNVGGIFRTDARLTKTFPITERVNVNLGFEAFNIFNHTIPSGREARMFNASWDNTAGVLMYKVTPNAQYGTLTATQATPDGTTVRRAQALIRINF